MVGFYYLDGTDFTKYQNFYCKSESESYDLPNALSKCRKEVDCSMVSALACDNDTSKYQLCDQSQELIQNERSCTFKKKGTFIKL